MKLREWATATHKAFSNQVAEERLKSMSAADVEQILKLGLATLTSALVAGDDLRTHDLGRIWCEVRASQKKVSNLAGKRQEYNTVELRVARFRASNRLVARLNRDILNKGAKENQATVSPRRDVLKNSKT